ncbi:MAG: hypothetical protein ACE5FY_06445, partial [Nitrospiria bacterium]
MKKNVIKIASIVSLVVAGLINGVCAASAEVYPTPMITDEQKVPFMTQGQNLRGPGASFPTKTFKIFDTSWNLPTRSAGRVFTGKSFVPGGLSGRVKDWISDNLSLGSKQFGATASGRSSGRVAFKVRLSDRTVGTVDVDYPVDITLEYPKSNTFRTDDVVIIKSSYRLPPVKRMMKSTGMGGRLEIVPILNLNTHAGAKVCLVSCLSQT